jgi:hypothetical protein
MTQRSSESSRARLTALIGPDPRIRNPQSACLRAGLSAVSAQAGTHRQAIRNHALEATQVVASSLSLDQGLQIIAQHERRRHGGRSRRLPFPASSPSRRDVSHEQPLEESTITRGTERRHSNG